MKKEKKLLLVAVLTAVVLSVILIVGLISIPCYTIFTIHKSYINESNMEQFSTETSENVAMVHYFTVYYGDDCVYFADALNSEVLHGGDFLDGTLHQVYCIKDNMAYFSYQYYIDTELHWCFANISLIDKNVNVIYDVAVDSQNIGSDFEDFSSDYSLRTGYYFDNKIVLTDFTDVFEYDLLTETYKIFEYGDYEYPTTEIEFSITDDNSFVEISKGQNTTSWDIERFKQSNKVAEHVINNYNKKTVADTPTLCYFFDDVQIIDEKIYLICDVLNFGGSSYSLVFSVDVDSDQVKYVRYHFTDSHTSPFYVVPVID